MSSGNHTFFEGSDNSQQLNKNVYSVDTLRGFDEFVEEFEKELNEWEVLEKKYPHIPTRMRRVRNRFNRLANEYRGKFETACCNSNFIEESDICSKCKEHSE